MIPYCTGGKYRRKIPYCPGEKYLIVPGKNTTKTGGAERESGIGRQRVLCMFLYFFVFLLVSTTLYLVAKNES
jgi:hypothetical protein